MSESPFSTEDKIKMMEAAATYPISIGLGLLVGWIGNVLAWPLLIMLTVSAALVILVLCTPIPRLVRGFVRRKAENYYYGI